MSPYVVPGIRKSDLVVVRSNSIDDVKKHVSEFTDIPVEMLSHKTRKREVVEARQIAMYILTLRKGHSLKSIGEAFGGRDHTTVIHSKQNILNLCDSDPEFKAKVQFIIERLPTKFAS